MKPLLAVTSLLLSTALLLVGHGMQLTLLPLRATSNGLSGFEIGVTASSYFLGFVVGCLVNPGIIARVGHIRSFAVLTAILITAVLLLDLLARWELWLLLRFTVGLAICGLYTVIESWLNDQSSADSRGQVLASYTFIVLLAMGLGQVLINVGPPASATPFTLSAVFLALAIVPVGLTSRLQPAPMASARPRFGKLYNHSHTAFAGALLSGLVVGSFWSLAALFASSSARSLSDVSLFITAAIVGGALLQYPVGLLSDRVDRRYVLLALCLAGALASAAVAATATLAEVAWHLIAVFAFGAMMMPTYAISLAIAADRVPSSEFVEVGTSVLLLNGVGATVAPLVLGQLMVVFGNAALFWSFAALCALFGAYIGWQCRHAARVTIQEQTPFSAAGPEAAPTSFDLDPRGPEEDAGDIFPEEDIPADEEASGAA
jgi:MFS family permease